MNEGTTRISAFKRAQAKSLRAAETCAEQRLWKALRAIPVYGSHFRRQAPIGPYIADFVCLRARLIVEVDGATHGSDCARRSDARRDTFLLGEGYRVLRFQNDDVFRNEAGVIETIYAALYGAPDAPASAFSHPTPPLCGDPPPQGEGEPRAEF